MSVRMTEDGYMAFDLNGYQIKRLLDFVDSDDEAELSLAYFDEERDDLESPDEKMPQGLYAWFTDYPDEGSMWLPETPQAMDGAAK